MKKTIIDAYNKSVENFTQDIDIPQGQRGNVLRQINEHFSEIMSKELIMRVPEVKAITVVAPVKGKTRVKPSSEAAARIDATRAKLNKGKK